MLDDADREWIRKTIREELAAILAAPTTAKVEDSLFAVQKTTDRDVREVFDHWVSCWKKNSRTKLDTTRKRAIEKALKTYDAPTLKDALSGYTFSDFHNGKETGQVYDEITLHLRDAAHIESGLRHFEMRGKQSSALVERGMNVARKLDRLNGHP